MRVLSVDPGAERCGWAILDSGVGGGAPVLVRSGIIYTPRAGKDFQKYRIDLEDHVHRRFKELFDRKPTHVVNEIVPAVGGGNFVIATQSYLANCVATVLHVVAFKHGVPVRQVGATTVQSKIAKRGRSKRITKVQVRNGVIDHFPQHTARIMTMLADQTDAIAIGLWFLLHCGN